MPFCVFLSLQRRSLEHAGFFILAYRLLLLDLLQFYMSNQPVCQATEWR